MPRINHRLDIPDHELDFRTSRSSGPGGQHANRTETRVELLFDVANSPSLNGWERRRIKSKLANQINSDGVLIMAAQDSRSQHQNKELVIERFAAALRRALVKEAPRRKTRPSRRARNKRMDRKTKRGRKKKLRGKVKDW